jgi:endo-1,4-beta-D-glucanase Y
MKGSTRLAAILVVISLCLACGERPGTPDLDRVLRASWQSYRQQFLALDGQVMVPEQKGGTISEAQAYALLRAVWAGDAATFARVYAWTSGHLSRVRSQGDHLLSWRWGPRPDGSRGILDANTAADGDLDYALALCLAARRGWRAPPGLPAYGAEARQVLADILKQEVVRLPGGGLLLTPGNWHEPRPPYLVNPSYFSPAAYRLFARLSPPADLEREAKATEGSPQSPSHQGRGNADAAAAWERLHHSTYELLDKINRGLGGQAGVGLFPDWCRVDAAGSLSPAPGRETAFGWEAVRLPFRVALDACWFQDPQAAALFKGKFLPFFRKAWQEQGRLVAVYGYDGTPGVTYESPVLYAGVLAGALAAGDREFAAPMAAKILSFYQEKDGRAYFEAPDHYYANNWAWLGLALYAGWVKPF